MTYIYYIPIGTDDFLVSSYNGIPFGNYILFETKEKVSNQSFVKIRDENCLLEYLILNFTEIRRRGFIRGLRLL